MLTYVKMQLNKLAKHKKYENMRFHISEEDQAIIKEHVKNLEKNIFTFDKPWDMERCSIPYQLNPLDFNAQKNEDEEWCFMLNRMDYINYLILFDLIESKQIGAKKAKAFIMEWINQHPVMKEEPSTRTLDTGIRLMNIFECLPYLYTRKIINDYELEKIVSHMHLQIQYLKERYLNRYITSNWGSIQTCAIVSILPFFIPEYETNELFCWAYSEMIKQFETQVYTDGMHWEQSTMYHVEVLNYGMKAYYYLSFVKYPLNKRFVEILFDLSKALFLQATPHFEIETFGDSDRCSIQDVMTRASALLKDKELKWMAFSTFDMETLYSFGLEKLTEYQKLEPTNPKQLYYDGCDSGMYCVRSSWNKNANFTMYTNGSLGSGHGHCDNLHISIYHKGKAILIDSGRLTYREDHPLRVVLKSMKAHNGVIVDHHEYCMPKDSWSYSSFGYPIKNYVRHFKGIHYYEGAIVGKHPLSVWIRKVVVIDKGIWFIVDQVLQDGKHELTSRFHLDPSVHYKDGTIENLRMYTQENIEVQTEICSLRYNEAFNHDVVYVKKQFEDQANVLYSFYDDEITMVSVDVYQDLEKVSEKVAFAKKFVVSSQESYTIVIFNQEIYKGKKILFVEGVPFHAKAIVIHEKKGIKKLIRLRT